MKAALLDRAITFHYAGKLDDAEPIYRRLLATDPRDAHVLQLLGVIAYQRGLPSDARDLLTVSLSIDPDNVDTLNNLSLALIALRDYSGALSVLRMADAIHPGSASVLSNIGVCYAEQGDASAAETYYRRVLALNPNNPLIFNNMGKLAHDQRRYVEAEAHYSRAVELQPNYPEANNNLATLLFDGGRFDEAEPYYLSAIQHNPYLFTARHNRSLGLLAMGRYQEGWREYTYRIGAVLNTRYLADPRAPDKMLPYPVDLLPFEPAGRKVLLLPEQGIGDEIFFLRFACRLRERGAWVAYRPTVKIASFVQRADWVDAVVNGDTLGNHRYDTVVAVGDLPLLLDTNDEVDIPDPLRLEPLSAARDRALAQLAQSPRPWIGLTWEAGTQNDCKSIYKRWPVELAADCFAGFKGTVVLLQRNQKPDDMAVMCSRLPSYIDLTPLSDNLEDMLGLLDCLDAYITVSNTNVHLRAMLGKPCDVVLPLPPEFRWMINGERSPWYPNFRLYRQATGGDWSAAMEALRARIANVQAPVAGNKG